ncbi:hypothetical protein, partial [Trabulsiella odontotermitis]|uniref:hypothetical protein n=1 Tax=Trabulsiella odontotermitis TaxID=379893 RepID=UPI001EDC958F
LLPGPEQGLTVVLALEAGSAFSRTDRFYPVQPPEPYPLAESWHRQSWVCGGVELSLGQEHL